MAKGFPGQSAPKPETTARLVTGLPLEVTPCRVVAGCDVVSDGSSLVGGYGAGQVRCPVSCGLVGSRVGRCSPDTWSELEDGVWVLEAQSEGGEVGDVLERMGLLHG